MRMWHYELLPYLPDKQLKGQLRELVSIIHNWRDKGSPNHLLVNKVMGYPKNEFFAYFQHYQFCYSNRFGKPIADSWYIEFTHFCFPDNLFNAHYGQPFENWHNKEYLRVCMANLYEKYKFGNGESKITPQEWKRLVDGYKEITGEDYVI